MKKRLSKSDVQPKNSMELIDIPSDICNSLPPSYFQNLVARM